MINLDIIMNYYFWLYGQALMYLKPSDQPFYSNLLTWSLEDPRFSSKKIDYNKLGGFTILIKAKSSAELLTSEKKNVRRSLVGTRIYIFIGLL
mgnify:FL=1